MEHDYTSVLERMAETGIILSKNYYASYNIEHIIKSIFYSKDSQNPHELGIYEFMASGMYMDKEGGFQDYLLMLNSNNAMEKINNALEIGNLNKEDIIEFRRILLDDVYGKHYQDIRRFNVKVGTGMFVTVPLEKNDGQLDSIVNILNRHAATKPQIFLNALLFFLEMMKLHPFEDENGRTIRSITNAYLAAHGLNPVFMNRKDQEYYGEILDLKHFTGYYGSFIAYALILQLKQADRDELAAKLRKMKCRDDDEVEMRDLLQLYLNDFDAKSIEEDAERLYRKGRLEGDTHKAMCGLKLIGKLGVKSWIIEDAIANEDHILRMGAMFCMHGLKSDCDVAIVKNMAKNDDSFLVRMLAIGMLEESGRLDSKYVEELMGSESNNRVLSALGKSLTKIKESKDYMKTAETLMNSECEDLKLRGYQVMVAHGDEDGIERVLRDRLEVVPQKIERIIIIELASTSKINLQKVALVLSEYAENNEYLRRILLGELSKIDRVSHTYLNMLGKIVGGNSDAPGSKAERAYAAYIIGKELGYGHLQTEYGIEISKCRSAIEGIAAFITYTRSLAKGEACASVLDSVQGDEVGLPDFVRLVELSRLGRGGVIDVDTLERLNAGIALKHNPTSDFLCKGITQDIDKSRKREGLMGVARGTGHSGKVRKVR